MAFVTVLPLRKIRPCWVRSPVDQAEVVVLPQPVTASVRRFFAGVDLERQSAHRAAAGLVVCAERGPSGSWPGAPRCFGDGCRGGPSSQPVELVSRARPRTACPAPSARNATAQVPVSASFSALAPPMRARPSKMSCPRPGPLNRSRRLPRSLRSYGGRCGAVSTTGQQRHADQPHPRTAGEPHAEGGVGYRGRYRLQPGEGVAQDRKIA